MEFQIWMHYSIKLQTKTLYINGVVTNSRLCDSVMNPHKMLIEPPDHPLRIVYGIIDEIGRSDEFGILKQYSLFDILWLI